MLYIIGLGLNVNSISKHGFEIVKRCKQVYLENYTVDFPYTVGELSEVLLKKITPLNREKVEDLSLVDEAKRKDVALLVYGSPLTATTHISLIEEAKRSGVKYRILYNASIFDAVAETGLQLYKFGKIASMPAWDEKQSFTPDSFMKIVHENMSMKAHSLILIDIGLSFPDALRQLKIAAAAYKIPLKKFIVCQVLGTKKQKILHRSIEEFEEFTGVRSPYSIILPSKMHFLEKEVVEGFS